MTEMLTDLMQHLQDVYTNHSGDDGRLMVSVPTTPYTMEQFEVKEVQHDGPSVLLYCQAPQVEQATPEPEQAKPQAKRTRACVHNDYEDLC
jgi:hypothetical protein